MPWTSKLAPSHAGECQPGAGRHRTHRSARFDRGTRRATPSRSVGVDAATSSTPSPSRRRCAAERGEIVRRPPVACRRAPAVRAPPGLHRPPDRRPWRPAPPARRSRAATRRHRRRAGPAGPHRTGTRAGPRRRRPVRRAADRSGLRRPLRPGRASGSARRLARSHTVSHPPTTAVNGARVGKARVPGVGDVGDRHPHARSMADREHDRVVR